MADEKALWVPFEPELGAGAKEFRAFASRLAKCTTAELRAEIFDDLAPPQMNGELTLRLVQSMLLDLVDQGWDVAVKKGAVKVRAPRFDDEEPTETKARIRRAHLIERDNYLLERPVNEFIKGMEQRRLTAKGWHSIYSLMRDGAELASALRTTLAVPEVDRAAALSDVVRPYLQFVETGEICEQTGLLLSDVWRYFRLTWVNAPKSVPGRSFMILIRDAAATNHPVIGIAALGSSVVQLELRDSWIGWSAQTFIESLQKNPTAKHAKWLFAAVDNLLDGIYLTDIVRDNIIARRDLTHPTTKVIAQLRTEAIRARDRHREYPGAIDHKRRAENWKEAAETHLFRYKRCEALAKILTIRMAFETAGFAEPTKKSLTAAFEAPAFRFAVGQLIRLAKAEHVGIDMMDITVCGAVAPYNHILGGKLVCMLLASPEVAAHYNRRYLDQESVIASSMKAAPVKRKPNLALLCTTSLYGVGSSQYNRVRIPAEEVGGKPGLRVEYLPLGLSKGFGSFHFTSATIELINTLLARQKEGTKVNSIFGEGVNPLMRKIRQAIELVGLPSDQLLNHGRPRVVYAIALAENFREVLLGQEETPRYLLPSKKPTETTQHVAEYWCRRWLARRVENEDVLAAVEQHTLYYPITHGARIPFAAKEEEASLW